MYVIKVDSCKQSKIRGIKKTRHPTIPQFRRHNCVIRLEFKAPTAIHPPSLPRINLKENSTVRALYMDNPTFRMGRFCPYLFEVGAFVGYAFGERTWTAYEEDVDVERTVALSSRPSLFWSQ